MSDVIEFILFVIKLNKLGNVVQPWRFVVKIWLIFSKPIALLCLIEQTQGELVRVWFPNPFRIKSRVVQKTVSGEET